MTTVKIATEVEIDLDDIDDDDIRQEAEDRGMLEFDKSRAYDDMLEEMFYAFKLGNNARAMELAKKIAMDHTGKIL